MTFKIVKLSSIEAKNRVLNISWPEAESIMREQGSIRACEYLRMCSLSDECVEFFKTYPDATYDVTWFSITKARADGFHVDLRCDVLISAEHAVLFKLFVG